MVSGFVGSATAWAPYHTKFSGGHYRGVAIFSAKSVASGGRLVGQNPVNDVMSPAGRAHRLGEPHESEWVDDASPADQAALNVDFEEWLKTLDDRRREVAEQLASGLNTVEVAKLHHVTRTRVCRSVCNCASLERKNFLGRIRQGEPVY